MNQEKLDANPAPAIDALLADLAMALRYRVRRDLADAAVNALPALRAEIERLRAELAGARERLALLADHVCAAMCEDGADDVLCRGCIHTAQDAVTWLGGPAVVDKLVPKMRLEPEGTPSHGERLMQENAKLRAAPSDADLDALEDHLLGDEGTLNAEAYGAIRRLRAARDAARGQVVSMVQEIRRLRELLADNGRKVRLMDADAPDRASQAAGDAVPMPAEIESIWEWLADTGHSHMAQSLRVAVQAIQQRAAKGGDHGAS